MCANGLTCDLVYEWCVPIVEQELGLGLPCADSLEEESQCADESEVNVGYCSRNLICGGEGAICYDNVMCANGLTCDLVYEWCVPIVEQELGLGLPCADSLEEESQCADESEVNVGYCSRNLICGGEGAICYDNVMCANGLTCDLVYEWCVPIVEQELGLGLPCADSLEEESQCADESEVNVGYCSRNLICGGEGAICYDNVMCANGLTCDLVYEWCVPIVEQEL